MATHLALRSSYSLLNGMMSIPNIVSKSKQEGFGACVLSDLHVLHGALDFQFEAQKQGLKAIFGMECTFVHDGVVFNSNLIAKDHAGYQKLIEISSILLKDKQIELKDAYHDSLILIIFTENGPFESMVLNEDYAAVSQMMQSIKDLGFENYLGVSHQESQYFKVINHKLIESAALLGLQATAASKVYYEKQSDDEAYRVIQAISKQTYLDDKTLILAPNRHYLNKEEMSELYSQELLDMSDRIAEKCHVDLSKLQTTLPIFKTNKAVSNKVYLKQLATFGLSRRLNDQVTDIYTQRLNHELTIINNLNFEDYFLIVYDLIRYAKSNKIYVGPGRGSAAGSLVAYVLGITEVDPIQYDLLFERFLNPDRVSMPDIDIDFPDDKRHLIIDYVVEKYGYDHVAHIITFGSLRARQAFRDVARVMQIPVRTVDGIAKLISQSDLRTNYKENKRFATSINNSESLQKTLQLAVKVEGLPRHASLHAAGVVMSQRPLSQIVPTMEMNDVMATVQYDMTHLEKIGLIKMDFLGLKNLSIIDNISHQIGPDFNIGKIPLDDKKTFELIAKGETVGLFQLESEGMTNLLVKMKPKAFMDIVDTIALYRPGPMENIPLYLENRSKPDKVAYLHHDLKAITQSTYGVLIYQEQIMLVAQTMAGFSLARADILRKAMSKKDSQELAALKDEFIKGAIAKGYSEDMATRLFILVEKFASYGFNKSHSVAYGLISYQMAFLKANYPELFYNYLLTSVIGSDSKTRLYIESCRKNKVGLLPVSIQNSNASYSIEDGNIRLPFTIIKGISVKIALEIMEERGRNGLYQSYYDAVSRLTLIGLGQSSIETLIDAGGFDDFHHNRYALLDSLQDALRYTNIIKIERDGQMTLDHSLVSQPKLSHVKEDASVRLSREYDALGFYYSDHPALALRQHYKTQALIDTHVSQSSFRVIAMVDRIKTHRTKNNEMMAFVEVSDGSHALSLVIFPNVYKTVADTLNVGDMLLIMGTMKEKDSLIVNKLHIMQLEKEGL